MFQIPLTKSAKHSIDTVITWQHNKCNDRYKSSNGFFVTHLMFWRDPVVSAAVPSYRHNTWPCYTMYIVCTMYDPLENT